MNGSSRLNLGCSWLKDRERLERRVKKVGRIDLHTYGGQGLDALLAKLVRLTLPEMASEKGTPTGGPPLRRPFTSSALADRICGL